jgi:predicted small lipoprotein YifL
MVKIMIKKYCKLNFVFLISLFIIFSACGKRGALERPPHVDNLKPAELEQDNY